MRSLLIMPTSNNSKKHVKIFLFLRYLQAWKFRTFCFETTCRSVSLRSKSECSLWENTERESISSYSDRKSVGCVRDYLLEINGPHKCFSVNVTSVKNRNGWVKRLESIKEIHMCFDTSRKMFISVSSNIQVQRFYRW